MTETYLLDEDDEMYGYGILNVQNNCFISPLGNGPLGADSDLFQEKEAVEEHYAELKEDLDSTSHLRIVRVQLDNELDMNIEESVSES